MPSSNEGSVQLTADSTIRHSNLQAVNPNSLAAFIITASRGEKTVLLLKTGQFAHELLFSRPFSRCNEESVDCQNHCCNIKLPHTKWDLR